MDRLREERPDDPRCAERHEDELRSLLAEQGIRVEDELLAWVQREHPEARILDLSDLASKAGLGSKAVKARAAAATVEALDEADVVYQAPLCHGRVFGIADFLVRRGPLTGEGHPATESAHGAGAFAIWDTKLARKESPKMCLQLACYADALQAMAGGDCRSAGLVLGLEAARCGEVKSVEAAELLPEVRSSWREFFAFQDAFDPDGEPPDPAEASFGGQGPWERLARRLALEAGDVRVLCGVTGQQRQKLRSAGLGTCEALARASPAQLRQTGMKPGTTARLTRQARLQCRSMEDNGRLVWERLPTAAKALAGVPPANPGDLFLDLEGDPLAAGGFGLQYLLGLVTRDGTFHDWWAHDQQAELSALQALECFVSERMRAHPGLRVYHYGHYERTALGKIAERLPGGGGASELLAGGDDGAGLLVDHLATVRGTLALSAGGNGLKQVEKLYRGDGREAAVSDAASSVVVYERWRAEPDGGSWQESPQLCAIREYNRDDCISLLQLDRWLRGEFVGEGCVAERTAGIAGRRSRRRR